MESSLSLVKYEDVDALVRKVEFPAHLDNPLRRLMFPRSTEQWNPKEDEIKWAIDGIYEAIDRENEMLYKACGGDGLPVGLIGWTTSLDAPSKGTIDGIIFMAVDPAHQRQGVGSTLLKMFCDFVDANALDVFVMSSPAGIRLYSKFGFKAVGVVETAEGSFTSMLRTSGLDSRRNLASTFESSAASRAPMIYEMLSVRIPPAELSAMAPLIIVRAENPESFNELRLLDRSPRDHKIGLALSNLHR
ncbi:hypothetical protein N7523_004442 [Penicillium sp. IBT 18751x]|nr:hypothetical protein N7523_004442 [Penicillium sp. IBT 18751x]